MKDMRPKKRIVITGVGVVTQSGVGKRQFWDGLMLGRSNVQPLPWRSTAQSRCQRICKVDSSSFGTKCHDSLTDTSWYALVASQEALSDSGLDSEVGNLKIGLSLGMAAGHGEALFSVGPQMNDIFRPSR